MLSAFQDLAQQVGKKQLPIPHLAGSSPEPPLWEQKCKNLLIKKVNNEFRQGKKSLETPWNTKKTPQQSSGFTEQGFFPSKFAVVPIKNGTEGMEGMWGWFGFGRSRGAGIYWMREPFIPSGMPRPREHRARHKPPVGSWICSIPTSRCPGGLCLPWTCSPAWSRVFLG